jgi:hypothetical protein
MVELGFEKPADQRPRGVQGCSSFSWAEPPEEVGTLCRARATEQIVMDEYGRTYTGEDFLVMLANNCPVQFTESVGRDFT